MSARQMAAEFAAYTWYEENRTTQPAPKEAARFAKENWRAFLPVAHEGWGKLLGRIAHHHPKRQSDKEGRPSRRLVFA